MNHILQYHKAIYNIFGSGICHNPHYILKPKSNEFHHTKIGLSIGNNTRMAGYFMGMHRYLRIRNYFLPQFHRQILLLKSSILNFLKLYHISVIINTERYIIFYSKMCFCVLGLFVWKIEIRQEWTRYIITP